VAHDGRLYRWWKSSCASCWYSVRDGTCLLRILGSLTDPLIVFMYWFVNLCAGEKKSKFDVKFDDRSVCKSFLLGCCPHDILSATVCCSVLSLLSIMCKNLVIKIKVLFNALFTIVYNDAIISSNIKLDCFLLSIFMCSYDVYCWLFVIK